MKYANIAKSEKVEKGKTIKGITPYKLKELGSDTHLFIFSEGINPNDVETFSDLLKFHNDGYKVDLASAWPEDDRNKIIDNF